MTTKYTPGPWKKTGNTIHNGKGVVAVTARNNSPFEFLAGVGSLEDKANADLIAAAPELVAALKRCLHDDAGNLEVETVHLAMEAISKAEGNSNE